MTAPRRYRLPLSVKLVLTQLAFVVLLVSIGINAIFVW
jgi:hypothetical protein